MSIDRTLKIRGRLRGTRNILTRAQRIARLMDEGQFDPDKDSPFGLPKTKIRHSKAGTKAKKAAEEPAAPTTESEAATDQVPAEKTKGKGEK